MEDKNQSGKAEKDTPGVGDESPRPAPVSIDEACAELFHVLRTVNVSATIGHKKRVLHVFVDELDVDREHVPAEFHGFKTEVHQDLNPCPFAHHKVGSGEAKGCAHTRWELKQYETKGIIPNPSCELTQRTRAGSGAIKQ